jgi:hypothetical protein
LSSGVLQHAPAEPSAMLWVWNRTGNQEEPVGQSEHQPAGDWPMLTGAS